MMTPILVLAERIREEELEQVMTRLQTESETSQTKVILIDRVNSNRPETRRVSDFPLDKQYTHLVQLEPTQN